MLTAARYQQIAASFADMRVAVVGDFCLDRYLEIDPARQETSIETGLPVHNVVSVRSQPGGAGTIVNNLCALGVRTIHPIGFCGDDGEGYELARSLAELPGVHADLLVKTNQRRTFTYCKPLTIFGARPPEEHSRLDTKNWTATPAAVTDELLKQLDGVVGDVDAIILLDQVDIPETGVVTSLLLNRVAEIAAQRPAIWILADSRSGLGRFSSVCWKMNRDELSRMTNSIDITDLARIQELAREMAQRNGRHVFVTLSEQGIVGASPFGEVEHVPAPAPSGPIDIVGAGDCVTANITTALAAGASLRESLEVATAAAFLVIQQLGTTGAATPDAISALLVK